MNARERYVDINRRLREGRAAVFTADEFKALATQVDAEELAQRADIVTVATFAPMCSSGVFINFGHGSPPIRMETLTLDGVPAYGGIAAVDAYLGATAERPNDPGFGGAHVIEALVRGQRVELSARGKGTDCYPGREVRTSVGRDDFNEFYFYNPRNVYQNYGAATNGGEAVLRTYLGVLRPGYSTVSYATAGAMSPLVNDPECRTIGIGTAAFVAGSVGMVVGEGTQFNTQAELDVAGIPMGAARNLAIKADAKTADPRFLAAARVAGYGVSLIIGVGFAIPVLDADMARRLAVRDEDISVLVRDYSRVDRPVVLRTDYRALRSGSVTVQGVDARTSCSSSLAGARRLALELKRRVLEGSFPVRPPIDSLSCRSSPGPLVMREPDGNIRPGRRTAAAAPERLGPAGYARSLCVDCGACVAHCTDGALSMGVPDWELVYRQSDCSACGACVEVCPRNAFQLKAALSRKKSGR